MTTARLTYNSINVDLAYGVRRWMPKGIQSYDENRAATGVIERVNVYGVTEIEIEIFFDSDSRDDLFTWWWTWGRYGYEFSFALDSSKATATTLDGAAASGQKVVPVTATTGFSVGERIMLMSDTSIDREVIIIDTISAGVSITATANLLNSFASGDHCRHFDYYPTLVSNDQEFNPRAQGGGQFFSTTMNWVESL